MLIYTSLRDRLKNFYTKSRTSHTAILSHLRKIIGVIYVNFKNAIMDMYFNILASKFPKLSSDGLATSLQKLTFA